jgi:Asp-tRNA(Asn)/Glu-tRNA(Gln) amidotransferase C subunit
VLADTAKVDEKLMEGMDKSKLIFYSLPSPLETATLIKKTGVSYNADILNPLDNISRYTTNKQMAINLGVYSADLSYSSLFDQTQTSIKYMSNAKKLADGLGIMEAIDENAVKRLEENMNNRDVVMDIISESFMNSNTYLSENDRPALAVMVLVGGWVEGLYLATTLTNGSVDNNQRLIDKIIYQKLSLSIVLNLLESYKDENADINALYAKMNELKVIYDQVKIVNTSNVEAETNAEQHVTTIRADSETFMSKEVYEMLCQKVKEIRTEFIS